MLLENKVAFVTGASRGIGRAIALEMAKNGADVAVCCSSGSLAAEEVCEQIRALGRKAVSYRCDVSRTEQCAETVKAAVEEFGKVDLSVIGGDNLSDYPHWNRSCALPYKNWLDIKEKLVKNFARTAKGEKVLYVGGNNDPIIGDFPTRDNPPYNTCEFYESGPMKETLGELADGEYYGVYAKAKGPQAGLYHLAFHYVIDGIDFFGLNVDPDDAFDNHDCGYNRESLVWLKEKLRTVDPEGNKLIFVVGHLSVTSRMTDSWLREVIILPWWNASAQKLQ